jgi:hypothetical protein
MLCSDLGDWRDKLGRAIESPTGLEAIAAKGRAYAERAYSKEEFLRRFDQVFERIGFEV